MASSLQLLLFNVCLLLTLIDVILSKSDLSNLQLSVYPNAGISTENIKIRCEISQSSLITSLSTAKVENIYLSVNTDNVKPSGILLMFDDNTDQCRINRENVYIDFCNASLILIHVNHIILNETLQKIEYSCWKGSVHAKSSYTIIKDPSARYYDPIYNSTCLLTHKFILVLFILFITRIIIIDIY